MAAVFVTDAAFADIANQHPDFLGGMECSGLSKPHLRRSPLLARRQCWLLGKALPI